MHPLSPEDVLLTIAGFDPSSGAGVTADLAVFASAGYFGVSCITALTVQSTMGVRSAHPVVSEIVSATLVCLEEDLPPVGIKIGMLATAPTVEAVANYLGGLKRKPLIVLDPVLSSSSGRELLSPDGLAAMKSRLLPLVGWVTPNLAELAILTGRPVNSRESMVVGAKALQSEYPGLTVLVTGGHLDSPDDLLLAPGESAEWLYGIRVESNDTHGTGCAFSSALLCSLQRGQPSRTAAQQAKEYVAGAIQRAPRLGSGNGPMHLHWPQDRER